MGRRYVWKGFICNEKNFAFYPENNGEPLEYYTENKIENKNKNKNSK